MNYYNDINNIRGNPQKVDKNLYTCEYKDGIKKFICAKCYENKQKICFIVKSWVINGDDQNFYECEECDNKFQSNLKYIVE